MELILTEDIHKLGHVGDIVNVKPGYGRNFLLPKGKALRATTANKEFFEKKRAELEKENAAKTKAAQDAFAKIEKQSFIVIKQASDSSHLYGSVSTHEIAEIINGQFSTHITKQQIQIQKPIKMLGIYDVLVKLHGSIAATISVNVARSAEEAKFQAKAAMPKAEKTEEVEAPAEVTEAPAAAESTEANASEA